MVTSDSPDEDTSAAVTKYLREIYSYVEADDMKLRRDKRKGGKDSGTSFVTKEKKEMILEYLHLTEQLKNEELDQQQRAAMSTRANSICNRYRKKEFRTVDRGHDVPTLQRISLLATKNHNVSNKKALDLSTLTDKSTKNNDI